MSASTNATYAMNNNVTIERLLEKSSKAFCLTMKKFSNTVQAATTDVDDTISPHSVQYPQPPMRFQSATYEPIFSRNLEAETIIALLGIEQETPNISISNGKTLAVAGLVMQDIGRGERTVRFYTGGE